MNILFITDLYPVEESETTTPKTLLNFVKEWEKQGHNVDVIKPNFILNSFLRGKPFYKTGKYGNVYNVNYWTPFWFNTTKKINSSTFQLFNPLTNYDLLIAHMPSGILFADKLGLPFVAGIHNSDLTILTSPLYIFHFKKRMIRALKNAKAIACRSFVIKDKLLKIFPEFENKTFVAPSGVDENIINNNYITPSCLLDTLPMGEGSVGVGLSLKILTCAHFKKRKNIDKLIKACKDLEGVELTIIGDGKIRKSLKKLDKNVIFTGELEPEKVLEKMRESDVFILPSVGETFGMVYLEAMASGCITVCTKNDGVSGIIKDGENGFLTEPTVEDIKNTVLRIKNLSKDDFKMILQNTFDTIKEYTSEKAAKNYLQQIFKIF